MCHISLGKEKEVKEYRPEQSQAYLEPLLWLVTLLVRNFLHWGNYKSEAHLEQGSLSRGQFLCHGDQKTGGSSKEDGPIAQLCSKGKSHWHLEGKNKIMLEMLKRGGSNCRVHLSHQQALQKPTEENTLGFLVTLTSSLQLLSFCLCTK